MERLSIILKVKLVVGFILTIFILSACSEDSNFNKIFVPSSTEDSFHYLYIRAKLAYDHGDIKKAQTYALKAHNLFPDDADNNIILGMSYLDLSGMSALNIVRAVNNQDKNKDKDKDESTTEQTGSEGEGASLVYSSQDASSSNSFFNFFTSLKETFQLSNEEIEKMGEVSSAAPNLEKFVPYDILKPNKLTDIRQSSGINTVNQLLALKSYICQYIDDDTGLKLGSDCKQESVAHSLTVKQKRQLNLLWSFAHLNEAVVLASGILYTMPNEKDFSLKLRADALNEIIQNKTSENILSYIGYLTSYVTDVKEILNVDPASDSAFVGIVNDLMVSVATLRATLTDKAKEDDSNLLTKLVNKLARVLEARNDTGVLSIEDNKENEAMKNDMLKSANKKICEQIDKLTTNDETHAIIDGLDDNQKTQLCAQYDRLTGGLQNARPKICDPGIDTDGDDTPDTFVNGCDQYGKKPQNTPAAEG